MATTPHAPEPPKPPTAPPPHDKAPEHPDKKSAKTQYESLTKENAWTLFYNGHRIAKQGDPPDKWISMSRGPDGVRVVTTPMTPEVEEAVNTGEYYLVEGIDPNAPPVPPPTVDTPPSDPAKK